MFFSIQPQCGSLGTATSNVNLIAAMIEDPHHHHLQYTDMKIILSGITQRCRWKDGANPGKTDKARRFEDSVMATYVHCLSGSFVHHPHIKFDTPAMEFISPPGEMTARLQQQWNIHVWQFVHCWSWVLMDFLSPNIARNVMPYVMSVIFVNIGSLFLLFNTLGHNTVQRFPYHPSLTTMVFDTLPPCQT